MKYIIILIALGLVGCNSATTCEYTIYSINTWTLEETIQDEGTYSQKIDEGNCGVETKSEYQECISEILQTSCDFQNIAGTDGETWYYTIQCDS